jgi:hypothetical protein
LKKPYFGSNATEPERVTILEDDGTYVKVKTKEGKIG